MSEHNPYSPPLAAVADEQVAPGDDIVIPWGRRRPLHHGWKWIAEGWELFKRQPGMWILSLLLFYAVILLVSLIPFVNLLVSLVWPIFGAGLFAMAHMAYRRERFNLSHLFSGFKKNPGTLVLVGVIYMVILFGVVAVFAMVGGSMWFRFAAGDADPQMIAGLGAAIALYLLIVMTLGTAIVFAPALVHLNDAPAVASMKASALGCLKNVLPGTLFGVVFMFIMLASMIPLGLGLLVTIPLMTTSFYCAYRDIFLESKPA